MQTFGWSSRELHWVKTPTPSDRICLNWQNWRNWGHISGSHRPELGLVGGGGSRKVEVWERHACGCNKATQRTCGGQYLMSAQKCPGDRTGELEAQMHVYRYTHISISQTGEMWVTLGNDINVSILIVILYYTVCSILPFGKNIVKLI